MVSGLEFTSTCRHGNDQSSPEPLNGARPHGIRTAGHKPARAIVACSSAPQRSRTGTHLARYGVKDAFGAQLQPIPS